jgi:hypothetical protein
VASLNMGLESQENVCRKQSNNSFSALRACYRLAYLLAKESESFPSVVRRCLKHLLHEISLKK